MRTALHQQPFNDTQLFVLKTFATARSEQERDEITSLYLNYIQKKLDTATDKWWREKDMTNEKLDEMLNAHHRTAYN